MGFAERGLRERVVQVILIVIRIWLVDEIRGLRLKLLVKYLRRWMNTVMKITTVKWTSCAIGSQQQKNNKDVKDVKRCTTSLITPLLAIPAATT